MLRRTPSPPEPPVLAGGSVASGPNHTVEQSQHEGEIPDLQHEEIEHSDGGRGPGRGGSEPGAASEPGGAESPGSGREPLRGPAAQGLEGALEEVMAGVRLEEAVGERSGGFGEVWLDLRLDAVRPLCYAVRMIPIDVLIAVGIGATVATTTTLILGALDRREARGRPPYDPRR